MADKRIRHGITGIERSLEKKHELASRKIDQAFEDSSQLIKLAKDMVALSKRISESVRNKKGAISEDETVQFKSYLLSLGVDDPVTKEGSKSMYFYDLAREISKVMLKPIEEAGGVIPLSEAYCRLNRARGLELISPDDMLDACRLLERCNLSIRLVKFRSGATGLQSVDYSEETLNTLTKSLVEENECLSADGLSRLLGIPLVLATERLLCAEEAGLLCRDDSIEGLTFYENRFLH